MKRAFSAFADVRADGLAQRRSKPAVNLVQNINLKVVTMTALLQYLGSQQRKYKKFDFLLASMVFCLLVDANFRQSYRRAPKATK